LLKKTDKLLKPKKTKVQELNITTMTQDSKAKSFDRNSFVSAKRSIRPSSVLHQASQ